MNRDSMNELCRSWLGRPDDELRVTPEALATHFPAPVLEALLEEPLAGKRVVDYYCATGEWGLWMAAQSAEVYLVDAAPAAIELGLKRAALSGLTRRVRSARARQVHLDMFADCGFDLVFCATGLDGPLAEPGAHDEMYRILRPGGRLLVLDQGGEESAREQGFDALLARFGACEARPLSDTRGWLEKLLGTNTNRAVQNARPPRKAWRGPVLVTARRGLST